MNQTTEPCPYGFHNCWDDHTTDSTVVDCPLGTHPNDSPCAIHSTGLWEQRFDELWEHFDMSRNEVDRQIFVDFIAKEKRLSEADTHYLLTAADWLKEPGIRNMTKAKILSRLAALGLTGGTRVQDLHDAGNTNPPTIET